MEVFQKANNYDEDDTIIELNVGGKIFSTLKCTLAREKDSLLAKMINGKSTTKLDNSGRYFFDCNPDIFCHILEYLRFGKYPPPEKAIDVYNYARMFRLGEFMASLEQFKDVQYKLQADHSKSSLDNKKYKQLLQDIIGRLSIFNESIYPRRYICIVTVNNIAENFSECYFPEIDIIYRKGVPVKVNPSKPPIKTELQNTDVNLIRALASDLKSLGYGRFFKYNKHVISNCCSVCRGNHLGIILNSKNTEKYFEHAHPSFWISI
ncbi:BTB/POZ domain-containing protein KCTD14-like isoform X2 [Ruditapes philippinarum]|uniref:BTB/POZ domain-containing protein KCTD14-like isoform X2 n=1 Tax=Ruditapes philippinarum TaxID=129788 RepID=UPI00295BC94F|nr:BTB/POZ domain-containing protein KCTD14-like isoform X2 [Ruditapes philippinarum]